MQEGNIAVAFIHVYKQVMYLLDTTEIFQHVTHNAINCGLQENLPEDATNVSCAKLC